MKRDRVTEKHAWAALASLCQTMGVWLFNPPAEIAAEFADDWRRRGVRFELRVKQPDGSSVIRRAALEEGGFTIIGRTVMWARRARAARPDGLVTDGATWSTDGVSHLDADTWRELTQRIYAAIDGFDLAEHGRPWARPRR